MNKIYAHFIMLVFLLDLPFAANASTIYSHEQEAKNYCANENYTLCTQEYRQALIKAGVQPDKLRLTARSGYYLSSQDFPNPVYIASLVTNWADASLWMVYKGKGSTNEVADAIGGSRAARDLLTVLRWTEYKKSNSTRKIDIDIRKTVDVEIEAAFLLRRYEGMAEHALKAANMCRTREFMNGMWLLNEAYKSTLSFGDRGEPVYLKRAVSTDKRELYRSSIYANLLEQAIVLENNSLRPRRYMLDFLHENLNQAKSKIISFLPVKEKYKSTTPWREVMNTFDVRRNTELIYSSDDSKKGSYGYVNYLRKFGKYGSGKTVIQYHITSHFVFAFVVFKSGWLSDEGKVDINMYRLGLRREIEPRVNRLYQQLQDGSQRSWGFTAGQVYNDLLASILPNRKDLGELIIVPSGFLYKVPFSVLRDTRSSQVFIEKTAQTYVPHMDAIPYLGYSRNSVNVKHSLALGIKNFTSSQQLSYGEYEVDVFRRMIPGKVVTLRGSEKTANINKLAQNITHSLMTHISTHAETDANPLLSGFVLQGNQSDVLYPAIELLDLKKPLEPGLFVLSACETGAVIPGENDDILGLPSALLLSGANVIIVSLWKVPEESTHLLMEKFYKNMASEKGMPIYEVLRQAQLEVRKVKRFQHPYYWAGFIVIGNGRLINRKFMKLQPR